MKKYLLYLAAFVAIAFTSCDPMKDTLNELDLDGQPYKKDMVLTFNTTYASTDEANEKIAATLNSTYPQLGEKSTALVAYNVKLAPADSLLANVAYTITDADYAATNGTSYKNFSLAKVLEFLNAKYPNPVANQLAVLTYTYYESGATASAGIPVVDTFIYINGVWVRGYQLTAAQYAAAGKYIGNFSSADEGNLNAYFNTFLKNDPAINGKAKAGDVKYVSFAYYASKTYQRIRPMIFDGTDWKGTGQNSLKFIKLSGKWVPDPTIYYTLVTSDYTDIAAQEAIGNEANRGNLGSYKNFNLSPGPTQWTTAQVEDAMRYIAEKKYGSAEPNPDVPYAITYYAYQNGKYSYPTIIFIKTANGFEIQ